MKLCRITGEKIPEAVSVYFRGVQRSYPLVQEAVLDYLYAMRILFIGNSITAGNTGVSFTRLIKSAHPTWPSVALMRAFSSVPADLTA